MVHDTFGLHCLRFVFVNFLHCLSIFAVGGKIGQRPRVLEYALHESESTYFNLSLPAERAEMYRQVGNMTVQK